jgi:hypothetical protein
MPENRDARVRALPLDQRRQQREVIVLNQDERRIHVRGLFEHGRREFFVDRGVVRPVLGAELRAGVHEVAEGPETFVGEARVEARLLILAEPDPAQGVARIVRRQAEPAGLVGRFPIGVAAGLRDPDAAAGAHHGLHGRHETGGRPLRLDASVAPDMAQGLAVRNDEQR